MRKIIDVASKTSTNLYFPNPMVPGGKYDPVSKSPGGAATVFAPYLQRLGCQVNLYGRCTRDDEPNKNFMNSLGIDWRMGQVDGLGALNAVLDAGGEPLILRLTHTPANWAPTREEGEFLRTSGAAAMALAGSLAPEYTEFFLTTAAAKGLPCFWNAGGKADLQQAGMGEVYLQVSYAEFGDGRIPPGELAARLLASSGAAGCVVTNANRGCHGLLRGDPKPLYAPAIALPADRAVRKVGAGDAFFAGFLATFLEAPRDIRFERALHLGRLLGAYHVSGGTSAGWYELGLFEKCHYRYGADAIRAAA